jgi:uncharacterized protein
LNMASSFRASIEYFSAEGRENLRSCLRVSFEAAVRHSLQRIVIFTGVGEGVRIALEEFTNQTEFSHIKLVGVTFPHGQEFSKDGQRFEHKIPIEMFDMLRNNSVPLVRAHLPFDPISAQFQGHGVLGQDFSLIGNALSIFGGGMSLCVQAVLMACDAGEVALGEHTIVMTSDTALLVRAAPTARLLTDFIVREILCKPVFLTIGKTEKNLTPSGEVEILVPGATKQLGS